MIRKIFSSVAFIALVIIFGIVHSIRDKKEIKTYECYFRTFKEKNLLENFNITSDVIQNVTEVYSKNECDKIVSDLKSKIRKATDGNDIRSVCINDNFIYQKMLAKVLHSKGIKDKSGEVEDYIATEGLKKCPKIIETTTTNSTSL